jgi:hypothetical protein
MRQDSDNCCVAEVGPRAARRGSTPRAPPGNSNLPLPPAGEPLPASETWRRVGRYAEPQGSKSAPPTARTTARAGIGTQRRPGRAIPAGPLSRRTGTAARAAAAQVGKRCQLSNRTCHGYIIARTYDNVRALPGLPFPRFSRRAGEEATQVIPINQQARRLVAGHDLDGLRS